MSRRIVLLAALALVLLAGAFAWRDRGRLGGSGRSNAALRRRFEEMARRDPAVREALDRPSDILVGIRPALVEEMVRAVAQRYLDRVELDLPIGRAFDESRDVEIGTPFGRIRAGRWSLRVEIHRVGGVLRAKGARVRPAAGNRIVVDAPVVLEQGHGSATAHFAWDAERMARYVCRDFEVGRTVRGLVHRQEYPLEASFTLTAGATTIRADPDAPETEVRVRLDLDQDSWRSVQSAIEEQDRLLRCGLAIDPEDVVARLRALLQNGFDVRLPRSLLRPVDLPGSLRHQVAMEDRQVDLDVRTEAVAVTGSAVWYAAGVQTRIRPASHNEDSQKEAR